MEGGGGAARGNFQYPDVLRISWVHLPVFWKLEQIRFFFPFSAPKQS